MDITEFLVIIIILYYPTLFLSYSRWKKCNSLLCEWKWVENTPKLLFTIAHYYTKNVWAMQLMSKELLVISFGIYFLYTHMHTHTYTYFLYPIIEYRFLNVRNCVWFFQNHTLKVLPWGNRYLRNKSLQ